MIYFKTLFKNVIFLGKLVFQSIFSKIRKLSFPKVNDTLGVNFEGKPGIIEI